MGQGRPRAWDGAGPPPHKAFGVLTSWQMGQGHPPGCGVHRSKAIACPRGTPVLPSSDPSLEMSYLLKQEFGSPRLKAHSAAAEAPAEKFCTSGVCLFVMSIYILYESL